MSTIKNRKMAVTAAAAAAVGASLFLGTGTAQAATTVDTASDALGVTVTVNSQASHGWCAYTAEPVFTPPGHLKPLPVYGVPFHLQVFQSHNLWFPGIQTGSDWKIQVACDNGPAADTVDVHWATY